MPRINLLPWREQQRRERKLAFLVALGGAAIAALITAGAVYLLVSSMINSQDQRNEMLQSHIAVLDREIVQIKGLEDEKRNFISRMQVIEQLQRSRPEVVHLFDQIVKIMPDGVYLTSLQQTGDKLRLEGVAQSSTRVSTLMRNIAASSWLKDPALEVIQTNSGSPGDRFVLDAEQSTPGSGTSAGKPATTTFTAAAQGRP